MQHKQRACDGLYNDCCGREDKVRNHNNPGDSRDDGRLSAEVSRKHEKSNAGSRAKQHGGADDM